MLNHEQKPRKENTTQSDAFFVYFNLGEERSLERMRQEYANGVPKRVVSLSTLKDWCKKYKWVERVQAMDEEAQRRAEEVAIKKETIKKSEMFLYFRNVLKAANAGLLSGEVVPTPGDFKKVWEMMRIEQGKSLGQDTIPMQAPSINIFLTKNEKIIKIVEQSEEELRKVLEGEIKEDE